MLNLPSPLSSFSHEELSRRNLKLWIKRDDTIHSLIMGNKWRKLKYNLIEATKLKKKKLVTLGGAYSNHILATAAAAKENGFESIGIIRGDELTISSNPTLKRSHDLGMKFHFVSRSDYRTMRQRPKDIPFLDSQSYFLPEGGTNHLAIEGTSEIVQEIELKFDYIITSVGTGGTFLGLLKSANHRTKTIGVSALKGDFIRNEIESLRKTYQIGNTNYDIWSSYHFGGYGKFTHGLIRFINDMKSGRGIPFDPVYTGKAFFAVLDQVRNNYFPKGARIVFLHTGGLQGIDGFRQKHDEKVLL